MTQIFDLIFDFLYYFNSINLSSWMASSIVLLMAFVFFKGLSLRLTISKREIVGLSFVFVFIPILILSIGIVFIFFD